MLTAEQAASVGIGSSHEPENSAAKALYASFGFQETGETDGDEVIAVLKLR